MASYLEYLYIRLICSEAFGRIRIANQPRIYRCEPGWRWEPRLWDNDLWCVLSGTGTLTLNGVAYPVRAGNVFLLCPGDIIVGEHNPHDPLRVFAVHFDVLNTDAGNHAVPDCDRLTPGYRVGDLQLLHVLANGCIRSFREETARGFERANRFLQLVLVHCRDENGTAGMAPLDLCVARALDAIDQEPGRRWTVSELAEIAYLSRAQFSKRFSAETGLPPIRHAVMVRISRACELLTETTMRISAIANALAYRDVYHFSKQFKKEKGVSPSQYRKGLRTPRRIDHGARRSIDT